MTTKFSLFPSASTPVLTDEAVGLQGGVDVRYTFTQLAALLGGASPLTTKGDLFTFGSAVARLPVGSNGKILSADSTQATGLAWVAPGTPTLPTTTKGDLLGFDTVADRIPIGADTYVLMADSTQALGLKWAAAPGGALTVTDGVNSVGSVDTISVQDGQVVPSPSLTSLLLHMDGSSGSTTFTDSSVYGVTVTPLSGAAIQTTNVKFGSGALACTGGASLTVPVTPGGACDLGTGDFTVEGWVYVDGGHTYNLAFTLGTYGSGVYAICYVNIGSPFTSNGTQFSGCHSGGVIVVNTWHHVAIVRHSGNVTMYLDGVGGTPVADTTNWSTVSIHTIGAGYSGQELSGAMDEVRIQRATAAYTANFTPPTAAFPTGGGTPGLATLRTNPVAVAIASLPATPYDGQRASVTDASLPVWGSAVASGGSRHVPVYYDGANAAWYVG